MAEGEMYVERRAHKRAYRKFKVIYKLLPDENLLSMEKKFGVSQDVSLGGVRIQGEPAGLIGNVVKIEIPIENREEPVVSFAEVKWIKGDGPTAQFGVEFLMLKENDAKLIDSMIDSQ